MDVMKQAVQVAKGFEGDWQARMKMALRDVWNAVNAGQEAMESMKGSDKQVAWANDIKNRVEAIHEWIMNNATDFNDYKKRPGVKQQMINELNDMLTSSDAKFWIDNFKHVDDSTVSLVTISDYFRGVFNAMTFDHFSQRNVVKYMQKTADHVFMEQSAQSKKA